MTDTNDYIANLIERERAQEWTKPCMEMVKLRELLDSAGIGWHDGSVRNGNKCIHRTISDAYTVVDGFERRAFVVTWSMFTEGAEDGLLEAWSWDEPPTVGNLTASQAYDICRSAVDRAKGRK